MQKRFKKLVAHHRDTVYTFAYYHLGNREEAEDATQEVLIKLWRNMDKIAADKAPLWIRRVTRNTCIDVMRARRAYRMRVVSGSRSADVLQYASPGPSPHTAAEASEFRDRIRHALASISEPYRSIVILREIEDMKYEQIGEMMEMPLNTVKAYLHRGRRMLRDRLQEDIGHDAL
jgi:RNA polymerase sigma-70 factor (ECF subfamily)